MSDDTDTERFLAARARVDEARGALIDAAQAIQDAYELGPRDLVLAMLELVAIKVSQDHPDADARRLFDSLAKYQQLFFERLLEPVPQGKPS
jgi:predicted TPR repeat methyltransferase